MNQLVVVAAAPAASSASVVRPRPTTKRQREVDPGRYKASQNARVPANGFATSRSAKNVPTTIAVVPDPYSPKEKIAVSVNRRVDLLEWEYSHGRLSEAAYRTGRIVQAIFERATGRSQSSWSVGDRVDAFTSKELQILTALEKAEAIRHHMAEIVKAIGQIGARFLREILGENRTYAEMAAARGQSDTSFTAKRFRNLLEDLAQEWAAVGQSRAGRGPAHA